MKYSIQVVKKDDELLFNADGLQFDRLYWPTFFGEVHISLFGANGSCIIERLEVLALIDADWYRHGEYLVVDIPAIGEADAGIFFDGIILMYRFQEHAFQQRKIDPNISDEALQERIQEFFGFSPAVLNSRSGMAAASHLFAKFRQSHGDIRLLRFKEFAAT